MKLLEDEAHVFRAVSDQLVLAKFRKIDAVDHNVSGSERVQPAKNIYERRFSGAGGAHERNPFARVHVEVHSTKRAERAVLLDQVFDDHLLRRRSRRRCQERTHASPLKTDAGRMLASRRNGNALRIATNTVNATATGYTINRGRAATPNTALPKPIERKIPAAPPMMPPASPSNAATARNSRSTRLIDPPIAFIKPTSIFRPIATLVIAAITQSPVSSNTIATVAVSNPLIRLYIFA